MRWAQRGLKHPVVIDKTSAATTLRGLVTDRSRQQGVAQRRGARLHSEEGPEYQVPACRSRRIVSGACGIPDRSGVLLGALADAVHIQVQQAMKFPRP